MGKYFAVAQFQLNVFWGEKAAIHVGFCGKEKGFQGLRLLDVEKPASTAFEKSPRPYTALHSPQPSYVGLAEIIPSVFVSDLLGLSGLLGVLRRRRSSEGGIYLRIAFPSGPDIKFSTRAHQHPILITNAPKGVLEVSDWVWAWRRRPFQAFGGNLIVPHRKHREGMAAWVC